MAGEPFHGEADWPGRDLLNDLAACLRFYARLPVPRLPGEADLHAVPDFRTIPRMLPVAGLVLALPPALVLIAGWWIDLGPFVAATLAVTVAVVMTGALHEDGLADVADGFGGGATAQRRLEIMKDSRIGAYGGVALMLSLALRIGALATLLDRTGTAAAIALALAAILSRVASLAPMVLLPPARPDGLSAAVGRPGRATVATAVGITLVLALLALPLGLPFTGILAMGCLAPLAALVLTRIAKARIGGQTGDVIGASQQVAEIAALVALLAVV